MKDGRICVSGTTEELAESMPERVWSVSVSREEVSSYTRVYKVSNIKTTQGCVKLRILSQDKPSADAVLESTTLEDVFLHYFGERAGEEDDLL